MSRIKQSCLLLLFVFFTIILKAQTTGPSQPEVQSFQATSITNMVETSTGQFQYNIPLFTIGGYPINVNYNSQVGMENEASIVGLGFNLNCGAITRQIRGLPDDFKEDIVTKRVNMLPNKTKGINLGIALELVGLDKDAAKSAGGNYGLSISSSAGIYFNNYTGFGIESSVGAGFHGNLGGLSGNAGIGINSNSAHGTSVSPYAGLSYQYKNDDEDDKVFCKKFQKTVKTDPVKIKGYNPTGSIGAGYNFNSSSYTPKIEFPFSTVNVDFTLKGGYAGTYWEIGGEVKGYYSVQKLEKNEIKNPAYGFLYADKGKNDESALMDFNRENDGIMTEDKPNLAFAYATPDIYSVAGQGVGGEFEIKRNNIFVGFDPKSTTNSHSPGLEIEFGVGTGTHIGADLRYGYVLNTSEKWGQGNNNKLLYNCDFNNVISATVGNEAIAEKTYFKNPNDVMFNTNPLFTLSKFKPIAPVMGSIPYYGGTTKLADLKIGNTINNTPTYNTFFNPKRDKRLDVIYYLDAQNAQLYGVQKGIPNYSLNNFTATSMSTILRFDTKHAAHHLSEMICLKADGTKYVFNIPAYNNVKRDVTYSINEASDISNYETSYLPDVSGINNVGKGKDEFISVTETPAYAHSFLLGDVLSPNYIDVDDNGPTPNDIGDYVKFNYSRVYDSYYWRSNNNINKASADPGAMADKRDGKAFYSEGEKEVWNIHSIESKTEVAEFFYSKRTDAYDLKNPAQTLMKLDSILVFSRPELANSSPVPNKRIYFDYNSPTPLCKGVYGDVSKAKLTLNSIYFKDGTSNKGKHSAYKFEYSTTNPNYNTLENDRWGNYKPNITYPIQLDNKLFPYVIQNNKVNTDQNASAWLLKKINLPTGGSISVDYEAHDYAYVQNKKAMYMAEVVGIRNTLPTSSSNILYNSTNSNDYIIFKLLKPISSTLSSTDADVILKKQYFTDPLDSKYGNIVGGNWSNLYGKFRVNLNGDFGDEDVPVFLDVSRCGALKSGSGDYDLGYVLMRPAMMGKNSDYDGNQISKTAMDVVKHSYSQILFGMDADPALSGSETAKAIVDMLSPATNTVKNLLNTGPYKELRNKNVAKSITLNQSYLRLYIPDGFKQGGNGARVKQVEITDNWQNMAGSPASSASYKIQYNYTKNVGGKIISSGVASYEPEFGGDENPWKQPIFYTEKNNLMPDDNNFMMTPYGESLFPSANIVYSEVKTTQNPVSSPTQVGTGFSKNEYYTYFDFPCRVANTDIDLKRKPKLSFKFLKNISNDYMASSQGYEVITNDMQGKPKSEENYGDTGNLISAKYYTYKTQSANELNNEVKSIDLTGKVWPGQYLGIETQVFGDARRFHTESFSGDVHGNLEFQMVGPVPTLVPSLWPDFAFEKKTFSSFTLTKFIRQQGILESVKVVDKGSTIVTKNEAWDNSTGAVLLTSTTNEFKDSIFNFTYPAHWAYSGMGMASDNIGAEQSSSPYTSLKANLQQGDIVGANGYKYVVTNPTSLITRQLYNGTPALSLIGTPNIKVLQSGKRNMATTPIGSIVSMRNPIQLIGSDYRLNINSTKNIIDANATEYTNISQDVCPDCKRPNGPTPGSTNYLLQSLAYLAPWQPLATYKFVEDRVQTITNPLLRNDGAIKNFVPFWRNTTWKENKIPEWQFTDSTNIIDNRFRVVETVNPLNIFNSSSLCNFEGLVNATAINSKKHENLFESFEDVELECNTNRYEITYNKSMLDNTTAHSGYYSMKVGTIPYTQNYPNEVNIGFPKENNCPDKLTLLPNKKYIISAWVKEPAASNITLDYTNAKIDITIGSSLPIPCKPSGQIIDGWQRIETEFTTPLAPSGSYSSPFTLVFSAKTNFDDIRIFPADGNMKSYVYSYKDYSLMAILDENNFATFYEYDSQKQLKRVKKETAKGIVTLQEVNFGSFKN